MSRRAMADAGNPDESELLVRLHQRVGDLRRRGGVDVAIEFPDDLHQLALQLVCLGHVRLLLVVVADARRYDDAMVNPIGANYMQRTSVGSRERVRSFYGEVLGWDRNEISPSFEVYSCSDEITFGIEYLDVDSPTLTDEQFRSATWMSIRPDDRDDLVARIKKFGVHELAEISDENNFFFQAPGGQVYVC